MRRTMLALILALGVVLLVSVPALAQDPDSYRGGSLDARQHGYQHGYRDGYHHGRENREAGVGYNYRSQDYERGDVGWAPYIGNRDQYKKGYRQAYREGYDDGYNGRPGRFDQIYGRPGYDPNLRDRDRNNDDIYYQRGYDYRDVAYDFGYRDGVNEGAKDRRTGHSYRPTEHDSWKNADRGFSTVRGDKVQYQSQYRRGYEQGYQDGYGGRVR